MRSGSLLRRAERADILLSGVDRHPRVLVVLAAFSFDALILKFTRPTADWLPAALVGMFALVPVLGRMARRTEGLRPRIVHRMWRAVDGPGLVWVAFFFALLIVFHGAFDRASGDGREYFAQLHSIVFDRDLNFINEAREFGADEARIFPFGSALLWLPFYVRCAHLVADAERARRELSSRRLLLPVPDGRRARHADVRFRRPRARLPDRLRLLLQVAVARGDAHRLRGLVRPLVPGRGQLRTRTATHSSASRSSCFSGTAPARIERRADGCGSASPAG